MRVGRRSRSISLAMGERRDIGRYEKLLVRSLSGFRIGNGYGIFPNLWDIIGLDTVVYELGEGEESNGA